jgi:hypothetical protein
MKRNLILATIAATTFAAVPAMAQTSVHTGATLHAHYNKSNPAPSITSYSPARGEVGTMVTVRGKNFATGTTIKLGNKIVKPQYVSANTLRFRIPSGGVDGTISVKVPRRNAWYRVGKFNVLFPAPKPAPGYSSAVYKRAFLASAKVKRENAYHNRQISSLRSMRTMATRHGFRDLVLCVNRSIKQENSRHSLALAKLDREFRVAWNQKYRRPAPTKATWSARAKLSFSLR